MSGSTSPAKASAWRLSLEEHVAPHLGSGVLVRVLEDWCPPFAGFFLSSLAALVETLVYRHIERIAQLAIANAALRCFTQSANAAPVRQSVGGPAVSRCAALSPHNQAGCDGIGRSPMAPGPRH